jgi:hypothetical protein
MASDATLLQSKFLKYLLFIDKSSNAFAIAKRPYPCLKGKYSFFLLNFFAQL